MLLNNRVFTFDGSSLTDVTIEANNFNSGDITLPSDPDAAIYIGSDFAFNARHIEVVTANATATAPTVRLWDGDTFEEAVDIVDDTAVAGACLGKSGRVSYVLPKGNAWKRDDTDRITQSGSDLSSLNIFDLFWAKLTWSAALDVGTAIRFVGIKFSDDEGLADFYPELLKSKALLAFGNPASRTTWDDIHVRAASAVIRELKRRNLIASENQILRAEQFEEAAIHKTAEIIFNAFGDNRKDNAVRAKKYFTEAIDQTRFDLDKNENIRLERSESIPSFSLVRRG